MSSKYVEPGTNPPSTSPIGQAAANDDDDDPDWLKKIKYGRRRSKRKSRKRRRRKRSKKRSKRKSKSRRRRRRSKYGLKLWKSRKKRYTYKRTPKQTFNVFPSNIKPKYRAQKRYILNSLCKNDPPGVYFDPVKVQYMRSLAPESPYASNWKKYCRDEWTRVR